MTKLACYGWVQPGGGSLSGANYLLIEQLLELGYALDFYGNPRHVPPSVLPKVDGISYHPAVVREWAPYILGERTAKALGIVRSYWIQPMWRRAFTAAIAAAGGPQQYKLLLTLGTPPAFVLPGVPTLSWLQGAPGTEMEAIGEIRSYFRRLGAGGIATYIGLQLYYRLSDFRDRHDLDDCTQIICGSQWSRKRIMTRFSGNVDALPYPMDLDLFGSSPVGSNASRVLWLGRLDPRKRLDLFLDSAPLIQNEYPDVTFTVVGTARYAKSQVRLLDELGERCNVEYIPRLDRSSVPNLLSETLVLVQPSVNENFGSSVAEAAATGVPAVIGPSNGTGDYLRNSATVFSDYTPASVASAVIGSIGRRRADFDAITKRTRAEAAEVFSPRTVAMHLSRIIEECASRGPNVKEG
jgi:glycosyltransferase involved in cell wall biosynthesis